MPQLAGQSNSYQSFHVRSGKPCIIIVNTDIIINANNAVIFFCNAPRSYVSVESNCILPVWPELQCLYVHYEHKLQYW